MIKLLNNPLGNLPKRVEHLHPGCFALVMATGIVSIDLHLHGLVWLALALFVLNSVFWGWLLFLKMWRWVAWPEAVWDDLRNLAVSPGFLTLVAGTLVLASQCLMVVHWPDVALGLTIFGFILWLLLCYLLMTVVVTVSQKADFSETLHGGWLLLVVATQAVSVAVTQQAGGNVFWLFVSGSFFMVGCGIYLMLITLLFYRMVFLRFRPTDMTPSYWINMGAIAISTLAGALLSIHFTHQRFLQNLVPFIEGFTFFFWALATWWIPLLILLEIWRFLVGKVPLHYESSDWTMVFPVSMYVVSSYYLGKILHFQPLLEATNIGVYVGLLVWVVAAVAGIHSGLFKSHREP